MVRLSFIGDVMVEHTRLDAFKNETGVFDFTALFSGVANEFQKSDVVIANLETPLAGEKLQYSWKNYQFNTPEQLGTAMKNSGIDVVSTANNHVLDRGLDGLDITLNTLDLIGLKHTGSARTEDESKPLIIDVKGIKIGILSYTYGTEACYNGYYLKPGEEYKVNLLRNQELTNPIRRTFYMSKAFLPRALRAVYRRVLPDHAKRQVGELKEHDKRQRARLVEDIVYAKDHSDYVVMCLHCGGQFNDDPTDYTKTVADFCIKTGVDAVIGNHEHRIQKAYLKDKNQITAYCLGNFTSNYGIDRAPYDKNAECSVLLNIYIDEKSKSVHDIGFSVLISQKGADGVITTKQMYDCIINSEGDVQRELLDKNRKAICSFWNCDKTVEPQREYMVSQIMGW